MKSLRRTTLIITLAATLVLAAGFPFAAPLKAALTSPASETLETATARPVPVHGPGWPGQRWRGNWFGSPGGTPPSANRAAWEGFTDSRPLISLALQNHSGLKLTPIQVEELESLRDEFARRYRREHEEIRTLNASLRKTLRRDKIDLPATEKRLREIGQRRAGLRLARLQAIERGKTVLSPDQLADLFSILRRGSYPARQLPGGWDFRGPGMHFRFGPRLDDPRPGPHDHHNLEDHHPGVGKRQTLGNDQKNF